MARTRPYTRPVHARVHSRVHTHTCTPPLQGRVRAIYTAVYTASTWLVHSRIHGPCTRPVHGSVNVRVHTGRVHGPSCTWQVGLPGRVHVPRRHATAVCSQSRPCTRPVHSPFTAVYTAVYDGRYTAVRHGHTSTPQLKRRVRALYTCVYTASTQSCTWQVGLHGRVHGPRRHVTAVDRVHGRNAPCTWSCTRPIQSRVHVRLHGPCTRPRTRTVYRNGPHTAVACRLGTCTRPGRPTSVYTAQTALVHGRVTAEYTGRYTAV